MSVSLSQSQLERQERILDAAITLANAGGFEAVQMRTVAADADVALGTLYRYFPSKEHLLVSAMLGEIGSLAERLAVKPPMGSTAEERVSDMLRRATSALQNRRNFTLAVVRALASGDTSVAPAVREVREAMRAIIVAAVGGQPSERDQMVAEVLEQVWFSALVSWISGVDSGASVNRKLADAIELLLGSQQEAQA